MEDQYKTLLAIYEIVKSDRSPHTYLCSPQEIILRQPQDWKMIQTHLETLVLEKMVTIKQLDKIVISITQTGIAKARSFHSNLSGNNISFPEEDNSLMNYSPNN
jgi:hypothetical protein